MLVELSAIMFISVMTNVVSQQCNGTITFSVMFNACLISDNFFMMV